MNGEEIVITKTSNGWLIRSSRGQYGEQNRTLTTADMAVAETPEGLSRWVRDWADPAGMIGPDAALPRAAHA